VAYSILELERGALDADWLREQYDTTTRRQITQHIRFADFWYTQNGLFSELKDFTRELAGEAGLEMSSDEAWRWFGTGGFIDHDSTGTDVGGYALYAAKNITKNFLAEDKVDYHIFGKTHFQLNLDGAEKSWGATVGSGRITRHRTYTRDGCALPAAGICGWLIRLLKTEKTSKEIIEGANSYRSELGLTSDLAAKFPRMLIETLEGMILDGWVSARAESGFDPWPEFTIDYERFMHANRDVAKLIP
jgi:hypothetical protein